MSYPVYVQLDVQMSRPFQQIGDMSYLTLPSVYYPSLYLQPTSAPLGLQHPQQLGQQYPQHILRIPGVNEQFGSFPLHFLLQYASHLYLDLTSALNNMSPAPLLQVLPETLRPKQYVQLLQLPLPAQLYGLLHSRVPMVMGVNTQGMKKSPSSYPLSPASEKPSEPADSGRSSLQSIDYSSLISCTVSPMSKRRRRHDLKYSVFETDHLKHTCDKCGKTFHKPYNLKSHMKTHSSERPFKCLVCTKTFARSHDRKRHELLHDGVKNFKCQGFLKDGSTTWGCGKKFARSDALARHFRTETGWVCIKPLMDEAREQERLTGKYVADPLLLLHHQIALPPLRGLF